MFAGFLTALFWSASPGPMLAAVLPGLGFTGIALSFRRYLLTLDELARRIQVESIAWTYLTGLALGPLLAGVLAASGIHANFLRPMLSLSGLDASRSDLIVPYIYVLFLEQTRTLWLYKVSRKYQ